MAPNFSKNAILCGVVDYYCLVCEMRLQSDELTSKHISTVGHNNSLLETTYEMQEECIRKIKLCYFCEFCNLVLKTKAKLKLHIAEQKHITNKKNANLKRYGSALIAFDKLYIDEKAWEGLCDGTCVVCNVEYEDHTKHTQDYMHSINLLQSNIEFCVSNIYRLIDETSFHCITCNTLEALPVNSHFDSKEHKSLYGKCEQLAIKIISEYQQSGINNDKARSPPKNNKNTDPINTPSKTDSKAPEVKFKKSDVKDSKDKTESARKCDTTKNMNNTKVPVSKSVDNNTILDAQSLEIRICEAFKANNYITVDEKGSHWCILCDWVMDFHKIESHVTSAHHRHILKLHLSRLGKMRHSTEEKLDENENKSDQATVKLTKSDKNDVSCNNADKVSQIKEQINKSENIASKHIPTKADKKVTSSKTPQHKPEQFLNSLENRTKILDALKKFQNNSIDISFETDRVSCKQCGINIDFKYEVIEKHIAQHKVKTPSTFENGAKQINVKTPTKEELQFAHNNNLTINSGEKTAFCEICKTQVPFSLRNMTEHVNGSYHRFQVGKSKEKKLETVVANNFVYSIKTFTNGSYEDDVINDDLCINKQSMFCIITIPEVNMFKCLCCDQFLTESEAQIHMKSDNHINHLWNMHVVTNIEDEFIRKMPSNVYHCGFCNRVVKDWTEMELHLTSFAHREAKISAKWRLERYSDVEVVHRIHQRFTHDILKHM